MSSIFSMMFVEDLTPGLFDVLDKQMNKLIMMRDGQSKLCCSDTLRL
jgi:hypothetical protein